MVRQASFGKRVAVVDRIMQQIRSGELRAGDRLPGEHDLAQHFGVSRGTIRSALADLSAQDAIETHAGLGSFVTFDGIGLDQASGWNLSFLQMAEKVTLEVLRIEAATAPPQVSAHGMADVILIERLRRTTAGTPISLERSFIPATGGLADIPRLGLLEDSITKTLAGAGLVGHSYKLSVGLEAVGRIDAALMERPEGTALLSSSRVSWTQDGRFVEHVESLLDPTRFRIETSGSY